MPALSPTMTEGILAKWLKREGEEVRAGDVIAEVETDKATMELEAVDDGVLGTIIVPEGTDAVAVNQPIAVLLAEGEEAAALETFQPSQPKAAQPAAPAETETAAAAVMAGPAPAPAAPPISEATYENTVTLTVREALRDAMAEEMRREDSVLLIGEEVGEYEGAYKVSQGLLEEFGARRVIDTPITEQGFTGLGVGAAFAGLRPIVEFMTFNFAMQAMDQMVNSAAKTHYMSGGQMQCSIVFRGPNGAASRVGAQHSQCFASWFAHVPGFKVIAPYAADDAKGLLKSAIRDPNPVVFLENEMLYGHKFEVPDDPDFLVPIGQARVVRPGTDVTITAFSLMVAHALDAAETLAAEDIDAEVIDLRTLRPLDITTIIASVQKTHRLVAVEEGWPYAGIASEIAAVVMEYAFDQLDAPLARVTSADVPVPYAANLEALALPRPDDIVAAVKEVCYRA
jgi:pyruvate dehydrogenase E1 component beta subunit